MIRQVRPHHRWPSGDSVHLAVLRLSPEELSGRYGLRFDDERDDLGCFKLAAVAFPDGTQAWLEQHEGDQPSETLVLVDARADAGRALEQLLTVLDLSSKDLAWISPNVNNRDPDQQAFATG